MTTLESDAANDVRRWFVAEAGSERIRLTKVGRRALAARLAKAGIDIDAIRTRSELRAAVIASWPVVYERLLAMAGNGPPSLERSALIAAVKGDRSEYDRLARLLETRNRSGLRIVQGQEQQDSGPRFPG